MLPFIKKVVARWQLPFGISNTAAFLRSNHTLQYHFPAMKKLVSHGQAPNLKKFAVLPAVAGSLGLCAFAYGFSKGMGTSELKKNSHAYLLALAAACLLLRRKSPALLSVMVLDVCDKPRCYKKKVGSDKEFEEVPIADILPAAEEKPKKVKLTTERVIDPSFPSSSAGTSDHKNFRTCYPGKLKDKGNISTAIYDCETNYMYLLPDGVLTQKYMDDKFSLSSNHSRLRRKEIEFQDVYDNAITEEDLNLMSAEKVNDWKREAAGILVFIEKIREAQAVALDAFYQK